MATWTWCRWPVDHSEELGIRARLCTPAAPGVHSRLEAAEGLLRGPRKLIYWYLIVLPRRLWQLWRTRHYDVAFVQRGLLHPKSRPFLEGLLARLGPPIVYHLDDALWALKPGSFSKRVRYARHVVTGTELVASYARAQGVAVSTIEYPIDARRYPVREHDDRNPVRIGWTGARPEDYLGPALPGVLEACRRTGARLKIVSGRRRPRLGAADEFLDWEPWDPERKFEALSGIDIGILPLEDSELHRGKEPFKLKEYMAYGLPVVASPVGHVPEVMTDGREGFFARDEREWTSRLIELVRDRELRSRMGASGRALVVRSYGCDSQMRELLTVLRSVAAGEDRL